MENQYLVNAQLSHVEAESRSALGRSQRTILRKNGSTPRTVIVLSICMAMQMTSYVMIQPLFARRFSELGAGVQALGISAMAYALTATVAAPFLGALADRLGKRLIFLGSLLVYVLAFTGYYFAPSAEIFIVLRGLAGALTAGLVPAVTGIVAGLAPADRRAQWIGIVNGGASVGWIVGPILGGILYDRWGFEAAAFGSILMGLAALLTALLTTPAEKKPLHAGIPWKARNISPRRGLGASLSTFRESLPHSLPVFLLLLWITFATMFAWAFMEPRVQYYVYDDLAWSSAKLGWAMSVYGISLTLGEFLLGRLSDRLGRKPVILLGLLLFSSQFLGLALFRNYTGIAIAFLIAGLGNALFDPALNASILDITPKEHHARILGIKSTASSLGSILGPGLVILFTAWMSPRAIFLISSGIVFLTILFMGLSRPEKPARNAPAAVDLD